MSSACFFPRYPGSSDLLLIFADDAPDDDAGGTTIEAEPGLPFSSPTAAWSMKRRDDP